MTRSKATATVLSLMLLVGFSALAEGPGQEQGDSNRNPGTILVNDEGAVPAARVEAVASVERAAVFPIYVPTSRGSTRVQDDSGVRGARRPGVRL